MAWEKLGTLRGPKGDPGEGASYVLPTATSDLLGGVKVGNHLSVAPDGTLDYELPAASSYQLGGIRVGSGLTITPSGYLSVTGGGSGSGGSYTLPAATADRLGGIKVGSGLSVTSDGTLSAAGGGSGGGGTASPLDAYPVGAYYLSDSGTSPASIFGGSWLKVTGRFPYFSDSTSTGGSPTATLTASNLPSHSHDLSVGEGKSTSWGQYGTSVYSSGSTQTLTTKATGAGEAFSTLPPYQGIHAWRRTA